VTKTATRWFLIFLALVWLAALPALCQDAKPAALDAAQKQAIVDEVSQVLNKSYIFAETAKKMEEQIRSRLASGAYDKLSDPAAFAQAVHQDLTAVSKDRHLRFQYAPDMAANLKRLQSRNQDEVRAVQERQLQAAQRDDFGFRRVERLPGNIGYLDFRMFASADQAGPTAIAALNFLAYCDALIIDLRQNGGGDPSQIQLMCSYFFDEPTHLNDLYNRSEDRTENYWTLPYVPGPKPVKADIYVLTSSNTFSGAEEFSYNLKNLKRATLIGETTGGGAHPTRPMIVQDKYVLAVPFARAINPVSKTNWEGTGVTPDVQVPADQAYDVAYQMAMEKLAAKASDPERKAEYDWILVARKAKLNPVHPDDKILKSYAGEYGERKVFYEKAGLTYQRTGPKYHLLPLTATLFAVEGLDYFRVEFEVKDGKVTGLVGLYDNGERQPSPRTK
jgi:hypothetical protein